MFEVWARGKDRRTVQRVRREIARRRPEMFFIDWNRLVPPHLEQFEMVDSNWR